MLRFFYADVCCLDRNTIALWHINTQTSNPPVEAYTLSARRSHIHWEKRCPTLSHVHDATQGRKVLPLNTEKVHATGKAAVFKMHGHRLVGGYLAVEHDPHTPAQHVVQHDAHRLRLADGEIDGRLAYERIWVGLRQAKGLDDAQLGIDNARIGGLARLVYRF